MIFLKLIRCLRTRLRPASDDKHARRLTPWTNGDLAVLGTTTEYAAAAQVLLCFRMTRLLRYTSQRAT